MTIAVAWVAKHQTKVNKTKPNLGSLFHGETFPRRHCIYNKHVVHMTKMWIHTFSNTLFKPFLKVSSHVVFYLVIFLPIFCVYRSKCLDVSYNMTLVLLVHCKTNLTLNLVTLEACLACTL